METTPGKRLILFRESKGLNQTSVAEATGIKVGTLSAIERERAAPSLDTLGKLCYAFPDLSMEWMLTGQGSMLKDGKELKPFVAGGEVGLLGSTHMAAEAFEAAFGKAFGEDVDGKKDQTTVPTDSKGFINTLLAEIEGWKKQVKTKDQIIQEQREALAEAREALKESRENAQFLRAQLTAKTEGNHFAPGSEIILNPVTSPLETQMQCSRCTSTDSGVISMYPMPEQELRMAS